MRVNDLHVTEVELTGDPLIWAGITNDDDDHCIVLMVDDVLLKMHVRSAVDVQRKLGLAVLDWMAESAATILAEQDR